MLCLLSRRCGGSISRCLITTTSARSDSIPNAAVSNFTARCINRDTTHNNTKRCFSKYASVDHSAAYEDAMSGSHGLQLKLAIEEGRGRDDTPFDPFSQFLDQLGSTSGMLDDGDRGGDGMMIEEAEYETIEEYGEDEQRNNEEDEEELHDVPIYTTTGALYRPKSERLALRAGYPAGGKFAVILLAGYQHKVAVDDLLVVNKLKPVSHWSVGSTRTIKNEDILLMANQDKTLVGLPAVHGGEVDVMVEEITRDKTLIIFKKRRRKHSRRKNGFRRQVTFLRVLDVRMPGEEVKSSDNERNEVQNIAA